MKKIVSLLLVLVMSVAMTSAYAATTTTITFELGEGASIFAEDEDDRALIDVISKLLAAVTITSSKQESQRNIALTVSSTPEEDASECTIDAAIQYSDDRMYIKSTLLGDDLVSFNDDEGKAFICTLLDIMVANEIIDQQNADELKSAVQEMDISAAIKEKKDSVKAVNELKKSLDEKYFGESTIIKDPEGQTMDHDASKYQIDREITPQQMDEWGLEMQENPDYASGIEQLMMLLDKAPSDDGKYRLSDALPAGAKYKVQADENDQITASSMSCIILFDDMEVNTALNYKRLTTSQGVSHAAHVEFAFEDELTLHLELSYLEKNDTESSGYFAIAFDDYPYLAAVNFETNDTDDAQSIKSDTAIEPGNMTAEELKSYGQEKLTGLQGVMVQLLLALPEDVLMLLTEE